MPKICALILVLTVLVSTSQAQLGGSRTYAYLDLSPSARVTALGGYALTTIDEDLNLAYQNPAAYNSLMDGRISFSHSFYPGGVQHGHVAYAHHVDKWKATLGGGILYRSYGRFDARDETAATAGSFGASEYIMQAGGAYRGEKLSYGANVKLLYSFLESYSSLGSAVDLAATFNDTASMFTATVALRNLGFQFTSYTNSNREELPFQVLVGISKRLRYLPLRISLTLHDLQQFDIRYVDPNAPDETNLFFGEEEPAAKKYIADKIFRHVAIGGEFYFGKNVQVRVGYDHLGRGELTTDGRPGLTGFSAGFGFRVKQFRLDYGHAITHISGANNHLTLSTGISEFGSKRQ